MKWLYTYAHEWYGSNSLLFLDSVVLFSDFHRCLYVYSSYYDIHLFRDMNTAHNRKRAKGRDDFVFCL